MDSRTSHPHVAEGEDEQPHEMSVLQKVKAKAKKIKDTLKIHGHGHNHDQDQDQDQDRHDERHEEDHEDEKMVDHPQVHGATTLDSAAVRSSTPGHVEKLGHSGINDGKSVAKKEDPLAPEKKHETKVSVPGQEKNAGQSRVDFGKTTVMGEVPHAPQNTPASHAPGVNGTDPTKTSIHGQEERSGQHRVNLERPMGLEKDPHEPKDRPEDYTSSNYQPKVTNPKGTGGEEVGTTPILQSFNKMRIYDEPKPKSGGTDQNLPTSTHTQFTNSPTGSHDQSTPETRTIQDTPQLPESLGTTKMEDQPYDISAKPSNQSSYTEKISSATTAIALSAVSAKNVVASKLGYGEKDDNIARSEFHETTVDDHTKSSSASPVGYGTKIAATVTGTLSPVYKTVAEAGSTMMSKVQGGGTDSTTTGNINESESTGVKGQDKGVSEKNHALDKLRPGDEDRAPSEVISEGLHKWNEEPEKAVNRPMGKVTESEEVARRLGTSEDENYGEKRMQSSNLDSPGKGVVDGQGKGTMVGKLKGAVGSWFGSDQSQSQSPHQQSLDSSHGVEGNPNSPSGDVNSQAAEKKRLLESSN
uniref:Low-temperature-induced 65 kDa protein n=1 Tax=Fagus sylvatica TaxID=28930 RepID=A0A2N9GJG9_FAGSY